MTGLILGAILISFSSVMVKLADVPPDVIGFYRLFVGGLGMLAFLWHMGKLKYLTRRIWKWALLTALFFTMDFFYWHRSVICIGPGLSTMLANYQVIALALFSVLLFREKMSKPFMVAMPMALVGLYLMVGVQWASFSSEFQLGIIYGLLTALFYALYLVSLKYSLARTGADPLAMAGAVALLTGLILGSISVAQGEPFVIPNTKSLLALGALSLICHAVGWFLITRGMQTVKTSLVGLILLLQPTLSYVWDILFFDKPTNALELTGVGLALAAIYLGSLRQKE